MARRRVRSGCLDRAGASSELSTVVQCGPVGGPATRTRSQSPREGEAGASSLGLNILGIEQQTLPSCPVQSG
jgi:hypothetical protein